MTFDELFTAYYTLFRADSDVPTSSDDEYTVGMRLANEAVNYWANFERTFWKELWDTNQTDGTGDQVIVTDKTAYAAPDNFKEPGGFVKILNADGKETQRFPIVNSSDVQFMGGAGGYCYFSGSPVEGYFLNISPAPDVNLNGLDIEYDYYKKPTSFADGGDVTEMSNPYFIVDRMLAMQFRAARNPYYSSALNDSEDAIRKMQIVNDTGDLSNPPVIADNSYMQFGK